MKKSIILLYSLLLAFTAISQDKLNPPEKPVISDPSLKRFLAELKTAVRNKDKEFIINNLSPEIQNSFGGDGGVEEFKEYWNWSSEESPFWDLAIKLLKLGGDNFQGGDSYSIPYIFQSWPGHEKYDVFSYMAITGEKVNIRDKPDLATSKVIGQLDYDIVKVDYEKSYPPFNAPRIENVSYIGQKLWYYVESTDGKLKGYVYWNYVWSPVNYRLGFFKKDGKWMISFLIAGD